MARRLTTRADGGFEFGWPGRAGLRCGLNAAIGCSGVGLHSGRAASLRFVPAEVGAGIAFRRVDLPDAPVIAARHDWVADTRMCTVLADPARPDVRVGTIEHVMAALAGFGVDDVMVEIDGPEIPILDGSAAEFGFLLRCAGIVESAVARTMIEILRPVQVSDGAAFAALLPAQAADDGFGMALEIEFPARAIGRQVFSIELTPDRFAAELARARTFTMKNEIDALHAAGLAQGGSLANAIVVDDGAVLNPEGLRFADEFVRHKLLDVVGDLALAGAPIAGRFAGARTGHRINNHLLHALFADAANYRMSHAPTALAAVA